VLLLSDRRLSVCLSVCLSVTLMYCGQTVGWIKMKLGREVGLGPGYIELDADPASPPKRDTAPNFRPMAVVTNGFMDQDANWYGGRSRPRPHCVRWGPAPPGKGQSSPSFSAHVYYGQTVVHLSY